MWPDTSKQSLFNCSDINLSRYLRTFSAFCTLQLPDKHRTPQHTASSWLTQGTSHPGCRNTCICSVTQGSDFPTHILSERRLWAQRRAEGKHHEVVNKAVTQNNNILFHLPCKSFFSPTVIFSFSWLRGREAPTKQKSQSWASQSNIHGAVHNRLF